MYSSVCVRYVNYLIVVVMDTDVWGIKKSQSMSDLIDDVPQRSSSRPFLSIDSGFNTETNSSSGPIPYKRNSRGNIF